MKDNYLVLPSILCLALTSRLPDCIETPLITTNRTATARASSSVSACLRASWTKTFVFPHCRRHGRSAYIRSSCEEEVRRHMMHLPCLIWPHRCCCFRPSFIVQASVFHPAHYGIIICCADRGNIQIIDASSIPPS